MGGIKPDLDPFAKYDRPDDDPFAKYDTPAKAALAKDTFAGPSFSIPGLAEAVAPRVQPNVVPPRPISAQDLLNFTPTEAPSVPRETVASQVLAKEAATRAAVEEAGRQIPVAGLPGVRLGMAEDASNVLRAVPGGVAGGLRMAGGGFVDMGAKAAGLPEPFRALEATARRVEGPEGLATGTGRMVGTLAGMAPVYSALGIAAGRAAPTSFLGKVGAALEGEAFLPRAAANFGVGAPIDIASGIIEGQDTGNTAGAVARNLAYGALGAGGFEGVRQPFIAKGGVKSATQAGDLYDALKSRLDATDAPLAQEMAGVVPEQVQRPASQLQKPGNPIYENPEPIAEARAANPLTDTDPARGLARDIEASPAAALPPEVYAGPDRRMRIESVSADDILNRHRRATDLPPTTAPLAPRVQTGRPRTSTADPALQGVTRFEQAPVRPQADETAVLERLAMQERSAASELAAKELGAPPQMEGAARILPMPGTKGRIKWEGGHKDFQYTGTDALSRQYLDTIDRASAGSEAELAGRRDWAREQGDGTIHSSGFGTMESGRGRAQMNQAARSLDKIEAELRGRGVDVEALRSGEMAPPPLSTKAKLSKEDAARERSRVAKEKRVVKAAEAERLRVEGPDDVQAVGISAGRVTAKIKGGEPVHMDVEWSDANGQQMDATLIARDANGKAVGGIDFSEWRGKPSIKMIEVTEGSRRQGVATALYRELERRYPGVKIDRGMSTPDGTPFLRAIDAADEGIDVRAAGADESPRMLVSDPQVNVRLIPDAGLSEHIRMGEEALASPSAANPAYQEIIGKIQQDLTILRAERKARMARNLDATAAHLAQSESPSLANKRKGKGKDGKVREDRGAIGAYGGPGFRSRLVEAAKSIKLEKAPAQTWISKLRGQASSGDEFDWALGEALAADPKRVWTRAEIVALAEQRGYGSLTETVRGRVEGNQRWHIRNLGDGRWEAQDGGTSQSRIFDDQQSAQMYAAARDKAPTTKYAQYQEPGGTNYREVLLRVPEKLPDGFSVQEFGDIDGGKTWGVVFPDGRVVTGWKTREAAISSQANQSGSTTFRSSHWDEPNVLAHIRMNDRVGPNGEKVLHVEEIQTDRGRHSEKWPDAPFKETPEWMGLAMKRVLDEAVAGGYDAVSWTPGIKQADRYSLRKVAEWIGYEPSTGKLLADDAAQNSVHRGHYAPEALPDVIGKEAADRLLASPLNKDGMHEISGEQLEIGGEGMKGFYDQMLPDWLRAYGKKLGAKIEVAPARELSVAESREYDNLMNVRENNPNFGLSQPEMERLVELANLDRNAGFPTIRITPELRAALGKGQTLGEPRPNAGQYGLGFGDAPPPPPRPTLPPDAVQAIREAEKTFATRTVAVSRRSQQLGASVVNTPQDLATAAGHLGHGATERLDGILTDANGVPVAVIGGFKGGANWAAAPMQSIISEAFQTPGGKNLWLVHNHPSGVTTLSIDDKTVSSALANALRGSGIKYRGAMAIGGGVDGSVRGWEHITPGQDVLNGVVGVAKKGPTVPIMDREFTHHGGFAKSINTPDDAKQAIAKLAGGQDGILLLNAQRVPVGFVPITPEVAGKLRVEGRSDAVYRTIGVSNATGAIIHAPSMSVAEANNLAGMLKGVEVETLDLIGSGKSTMDLRPNNQWGFGRQPVVSGLAGSGIGATAGALTGDTPEERKRNALLGAAVGLGAGAGLGALAERLGQRGAKGVASSPAAAQVLSTIATDSRASPRPWLSLAERLKVRLQDESYPLSKLGQELGGTLDLRDLVSQSKGWRGMATQYNADHLVPVLEAAKGIEGDVAAYAKSQRALQLMDQGRPMEGGFGRDVYEQAVADLGQNPKVVAAAQQLQDYYRGLLDLKHQEGVLTDEAYQAIVASEDFYTPFAHDIGDAKPSAGGGRWFNRGTGVKKMDRAQGTTGQTRDPFLMAVLHTAETHRQVAKQRVTNMVAALVEADPQAASSLLREIPANTPAREGTTVKANVGGKQKTYEVLDADLYNAWAAMDPPQQNIVVSLLRPFKTALTAGVTALPDFMVANVIRDNAMTAIQKSAPWKSSAAGAAIGAGVGASVSEDKVKGALIGAGVGAGLGAVVPNLGRTLLSMKAILGNDEIYQQFLRDGGDNFGYYPRNTADAAKVLKELQKHGVSATDIINPAQWVKGAWGGMKALNRAAEQGPRLRAYQDALTAGASKAKAVRAARDISVDFSTLGGGTKGLAATTAFWNAGVQGWEKTARLMRNPKTYAMAAATITAPSVALWALNHEREDYKKVQQWERNLFWLVPKGEDGEGFWRIPKPFEVGFVFGSVPERILDYLQTRADGGDPDAAKTLKQTLTSMATTSGSGLIPFPTGAEQIVSQIAGKGGYDFFREQPIVWRPDVPDEEQYDERTSSLAYGLGQATGISPQRTDFAAKSMFGGSAKVVLDATDIIARKMGWDTRPLPDGVRNPLTRRFSTNPNAQPEQERALRQRAREIDQVEAGLRKVQATGTPEAQRRYIERHRDALEVNAKGKARLKRELRDVQREVDRLNTARDRAKRDAR